jgi:uracil DNA glycosylase superfamily protein
MSSNLSSSLVDFYLSLKPPRGLPQGVRVLFPQSNKEVQQITRIFFTRYFDDKKQRRLLFGINPGRFGAGITGINFTAPKQLTNDCKIEHPFGKSTELSAEFIYEMIERYGGPKKFYGDYFITAVSPLGFIRNKVNINYYDDKQLQEKLIPFIVSNIKKLLALGFNTDKCFCIGGEKNYKFLSALNNQHGFFENIIPLAHPRFILQYRRKQKEEYIQQYLHELKGR